MKEETGYLTSKFASEERLNEVIKWHKFYELCGVDPVEQVVSSLEA